MPDLRGTQTHRNLTEAFARESQAVARYSWFAQQADIEGRPDMAALFRSVAAAETGHAHGLLEFLASIGDPVSGRPIGDAEDNIRSSIASETDDAARTYPAFATIARAEGFDEIADWFDVLGRAEQSQADRFVDGLRDVT